MYQVAGLAKAEMMEASRARIGSLRWLPSLTSVAFVLPLFLLYWQAGGPSALLADPDTGLHIRTGDWILAHHQVPRRDLYSFTIPGKPWCDWEWLSDVLFSILHRCGGLGAITAFSLLLLCLTSVIVYRTARLHASRTVALAVTYIVMATTTIHWLARPHLLTWMLVALFCRMVDDSEFDNLSRRWLLLPLLMAFWTNLHGGFMAGLMVLASHMAGSAARAVLAGRKEDKAPFRQRVRGYTVLAMGCLAATLTNPYFTSLHLHITSYLFGGASVTGQVSEWLSPDFHNPRVAWFEVMLALGATAGLWHGLQKRFSWCLLTLGSAHLALVSVRNVPIFAIVSAAPVAAMIQDLIRRCLWALKLRRVEATLAGARSRAGAAAAYALGLAVLAAVLSGSSVLRQEFDLPVSAFSHLPPGRVFTSDRWADYLIYRDR